MAVLARARSYDRRRLLRRADAARKTRRHKKAISLYRQVLAAEPEDADTHKKIAPLLARTKRRPEALASYQKAVEGLVGQGFDDQAIGLLRAAAAQLPKEVSLWRRLAQLELKRGRSPDAVNALVEGRRHQRSRKQRSTAIKLLIEARKLDAKDFRVSYDLACLLGKSGARPLALRVLDELGLGSTRRELRRVRARQLRLAPSPERIWLYLRALLLRR